MAPTHGPTYDHGPIPFTALAPFMAKALTHGQGPVAVTTYSCTWQNVAVYPGLRSPDVTLAWISRESIIRESKVASVRGGSGGSLPSIGVIMEHHIYACTEDDTKSPGKR